MIASTFIFRLQDQTEVKLWMHSLHDDSLATLDAAVRYMHRTSVAVVWTCRLEILINHVKRPALCQSAGNRLHANCLESLPASLLRLCV